MKRLICLIMAMVCLFLPGCSGWSSGNYVSVEIHKDESSKANPEDVNVKIYWQLRVAVEDLVESGAETGLIYVQEYDESRLEADIKQAVREAVEDNPIGAYAVEEIRYELGTSSGKAAVALEISYLHDRSEIRRIKQYDSVTGANEAIADALDACQTGIVLLVSNYRQTDFVQTVQDYGAENPEMVMEIPEVVVNIYPEHGQDRVVELKFIYQNSREDLRTMQSQVKPVFDSAVLYVSGDGEEREKLAQLYAFLMERFDYQIESSITPTYSLLRHGVGDCKAFALVYSAMCRRAGLDCWVVSGTRDAEAWYWNIVRDGEQYYHVDLLSCAEVGAFLTWTDADMTGYVWDYSAYPACVAPE